MDEELKAAAEHARALAAGERAEVVGASHSRRLYFRRMAWGGDVVFEDGHLTLKPIQPKSESQIAVEYVRSKYGTSLMRIVSPDEFDPAVYDVDLEPIPGTDLFYLKRVELRPGVTLGPVFPNRRPGGREVAQAADDEQVAVPAVLFGLGQ